MNIVQVRVNPSFVLDKNNEPIINRELVFVCLNPEYRLVKGKVVKVDKLERVSFNIIGNEMFEQFVGDLQKMIKK